MSIYCLFYLTNSPQPYMAKMQQIFTFEKHCFGCSCCMNRLIKGFPYLTELVPQREQSGEMKYCTWQKNEPDWTKTVCECPFSKTAVAWFLSHRSDRSCRSIPEDRSSGTRLVLCSCRFLRSHKGGADRSNSDLEEDANGQIWAFLKCKQFFCRKDWLFPGTENWASLPCSTKS